MSADAGSLPPLLPEPPAPPPEVVLRRLFLTLFLRGRGARGLRRQTAPKSIGQKLWMSLGLYALFGCLSLGLLKQPVFTLGVYLHALTFTFLGMYVASSAGEVLFNREENDILLHRPIAPRTMLWAKIQVLVQVSLWLAGAFNLVGLIVGLFASDGGWRFPLVHALSTTLEALFCTGSVVLGYQLCLSWFGRERLEGLITTSQVLVSVAAVLAGQIVPRVLFRTGTAVRMETTSWWTLVLPPAWFAGLDDAWAGSGTASSWWLALIAVAGTAAVLGASFGLLAKSYEAGMQSLNETVSHRVRNKGKRRWLDLLANRPPLSWCFRDGVSRASFVLTGAYLFRDRDVKLRVYPGLAPMLVMPFVIFLQNGSHGRAHGSGPHEMSFYGFMVAFAGVYLGLMPATALELLQFSQQWQASDVFRAAPLTGPAAICRGARWAVLLFLTLPLVGVFAVVLWFLQGGHVDWVLLLPGLVGLPIYALVPHLKGGAVPLSRPTEEGKSAGRGLWMIGGMMASAMVAGLAAVARSFGWFWPFLAVEAAAVVVAYFAMNRAINSVAWAAME